MQLLRILITNVGFGTVVGLAHWAPWLQGFLFWASFFDSETRSWAVAQWVEALGPFQSFAVLWCTDLYKTPSPAQVSDNGCKSDGLSSGVHWPPRIDAFHLQINRKIIIFLITCRRFNYFTFRLMYFLKLICTTLMLVKSETQNEFGYLPPFLNENYSSYMKPSKLQQQLVVQCVSAT